MSVIFMFLDGVGLAPAGPDNPLTHADTPTFHALLGSSLTSMPRQVRNDLLFEGIDATLGVPGLPQSGTGQTALLTGVNAAQLHGRHQPHVPPVALRPLLAERNIMRVIIERGGTAAFANAFTEGYWAALAARRIRRSASVIAAEGAGVRFRTLDDLRAGQALSWDITADALRERGENIPLITAEQAGSALARIAREHDFVFYENFLPDLGGHGRVSQSIGDIMASIDALIGAVLQSKQSKDTFVLTSDHGNIESIAAPAHTRNPVPLLVVGPGAAMFTHVRDISQVALAVLDIVRKQ
jgi:hypothetical protein